VVWNYTKGSRFGKYADYENGYQVKYPGDWTYTPEYQGVSVMFFSKSDNAMDTFKENFSVNIQDLTNTPKTLEEYTFEAISQMKKIFKDTMVILESKPDYLDGNPAHRLVIVAKNKEYDMQIMFFWTVDGAKVYQLTFTSMADTAERYADKFEKVKNSFKILR
jgi:hypothetical protein